MLATTASSLSMSPAKFCAICRVREVHYRDQRSDRHSVAKSRRRLPHFLLPAAMVELSKNSTM
jgi:hypothetical protein